MVSVESILLWTQVAAPFVTMAATIALVYFTAVLARHTRRLARATSQPLCVVTFESSKANEMVIDQVVQNTGTATAFDIKVKCNPPVSEWSGIEKHTEHELFGLGDVGVLRPGQKARTLAGRCRDFKKEWVEVSVSWAEHPGSKRRQRLQYSCRTDGGIETDSGAKTIHHVAEEMKVIRNILQQQRSQYARGSDRISRP